jgi:hypothetical protein
MPVILAALPTASLIDGPSEFKVSFGEQARDIPPKEVVEEWWRFALLVALQTLSKPDKFAKGCF